MFEVIRDIFNIKNTMGIMLFNGKDDFLGHKVYLGAFRFITTWQYSGIYVRHIQCGNGIVRKRLEIFTKFDCKCSSRWGYRTLPIITTRIRVQAPTALRPCVAIPANLNPSISWAGFL